MATVILRLHIQPGASRTEISGMHGDRIKIRVKAPPVDGAANEEVLSFLATVLGLAARDVVLVRGATSRQKDVSVQAECSDSVLKRLLNRLRS